MPKYVVYVQVQTEGGETQWIKSKPMTERAAKSALREHEGMGRKAEMYEHLTED